MLLKPWNEQQLDVRKSVPLFQLWTNHVLLTLTKNSLIQQSDRIWTHGTLFLPVLNHPFQQIHKTPGKVGPTRILGREKIMQLITCNIKLSFICSLLLFVKHVFVRDEHFLANISLFFNSCSSKVNFSFRFKLEPEIIVRVWKIKGRVPFGTFDERTKKLFARLTTMQLFVFCDRTVRHNNEFILSKKKLFAKKNLDFKGHWQDMFQDFFVSKIFTFCWFFEPLSVFVEIPKNEFIFDIWLLWLPLESELWKGLDHWPFGSNLRKHLFEVLSHEFEPHQIQSFSVT